MKNPRTHHETPTKHPVNGWRSPTNLVANIPSGVGTDSSCPYPNITKYAYSHNQIRVSISTYMHFHIIKYAFPHHRTHISVRHFVGVFVYAGTINRSPTAANELPKHCERIAKILRTDCQNIANTQEFCNEHTAKRLILITYTQKKLLKPLGKKGFRRYFKTKTAYRLRLFFIASIFS